MPSLRDCDPNAVVRYNPAIPSGLMRESCSATFKSQPKGDIAKHVAVQRTANGHLHPPQVRCKRMGVAIIHRSLIRLSATYPLTTITDSAAATRRGYASPGQARIQA